jgi:hypothetical protein
MVSNGLLFAPRCDGECFSSRKEEGCDHPVNKVALDNVGDYVVFLSRWYHHGYYNINSARYSTQHNYLPWVHPVQRHGKTLHARLTGI